MEGTVIQEKSDAKALRSFSLFQDEFLPKPFDSSAVQEIMDEIDDISERLDEEILEDGTPANIESKIRDRHKDQTWPSMEELSIKSFYETAREAYRKFLSEYLDQHTTPCTDSYLYSFESKKPMETWADDAFTYKERIAVVRKMMMNDMFGSMCNHISPDEKDRYKVWTMVLKANQQLSFIYRDSIVF
jgi:hypothetical protein